MIKNHYPLTPNKENNAFLFQSFGDKGIIQKAVIFEDLENNHYNLAFGDVVGNQLDDEVISNNHDLIMVISTVAKAIYLFLESHSLAIIEIDPIDIKRGILYNRIFQKRYKEVELLFDLMGINDNEKEIYNPNKIYLKFEIHPKKP